MCSCRYLSIFIFQYSDRIDECDGDIAVAVTVAVTYGVKFDVYVAFVVYFVFGVSLVHCFLYAVVDNSDVSSTNRCR